MDKIEKLIASYHSARPAVKAKALELILRETDRRLTPILLNAFREVGGHKVIVLAMIRVADPDLIPPMIAFLAHPEPWRRAGACDVLGALRDPAATVPLLQRLKDPHPWTQAAAARALAHSKDPRSAEPLLERYLASRGEDLNVKWALEDALEALGVEYQRRLITDDDP